MALLQLVAGEINNNKTITCLADFMKEDAKTDLSGSELVTPMFINILNTQIGNDAIAKYHSVQPRNFDVVSSHCLEYTQIPNPIDIHGNKPSFLTMLMLLKSFELTGGGGRIDRVSGPSLFAFFSLYSDLARHKNEYNYGNVLKLPLANTIFPVVSMLHHHFEYYMYVDSTLLSDIRAVVKTDATRCVYNEVKEYFQCVDGLTEIVLQYMANNPKDTFQKIKSNADNKTHEQSCPFQLSMNSTFLNTNPRQQLASMQCDTLFINKRASFQHTINLETFCKRVSIEIPTHDERANQIWFFVLGRRKNIRHTANGFEMFDVLDSIVHSSKLLLNTLNRSTYTSRQSMFTDKITNNYPVQSCDIVHTITFAKHCNFESAQELKARLNTCCHMRRINSVILELEFADCEDLFSLYDDITLHYGLFSISELNYQGGMVGARYGI